MPCSSHKSAHIVVFVANVEEEVVGRAGRAAATECCQHAGQARIRAAWAEEERPRATGQHGRSRHPRAERLCARAFQPRITQMTELPVTTGTGTGTGRTGTGIGTHRTSPCGWVCAVRLRDYVIQYVSVGLLWPVPVCVLFCVSTAVCHTVRAYILSLISPFRTHGVHLTRCSYRNRYTGK